MDSVTVTPKLKTDVTLKSMKHRDSSRDLNDSNRLPPVTTPKRPSNKNNSGISDKLLATLRSGGGGDYGSPANGHVKKVVGKMASTMRINASNNNNMN